MTSLEPTTLLRDGINTLTRVGISHPSPRKLFLKIQRKMSGFELLVEQYRAGISFRATAPQYRDANDSIKDLIIDFNGVVLFLRNIAQNV